MSVQFCDTRRVNTCFMHYYCCITAQENRRVPDQPTNLFLKALGLQNHDCKPFRKRCEYDGCSIHSGRLCDRADSRGTHEVRVIARQHSKSVPRGRDHLSLTAPVDRHTEHDDHHCGTAIPGDDRPGIGRMNVADDPVPGKHNPHYDQSGNDQASCPGNFSGSISAIL